MKPLVRWTIGPVQPAGFECLRMSIQSFRDLYDIDCVVCHNGIDPQCISDLDVTLIDQQSRICSGDIKPVGVAWKLYPIRLDMNRHELFIDNDLIVANKIDQLDQFLTSDMTLLLQGESRNYGKYERHVPPGYHINSGLFGLPPGFDLNKYLKFYNNEWEINCTHSSKTWDEQGFVAASLLSHNKFAVIPNNVVTNCEMQLVPGRGFHFVGLNRSRFHRPFAEYRSATCKLFI